MSIKSFQVVFKCKISICGDKYEPEVIKKVLTQSLCSCEFLVVSAVCCVRSFCKALNSLLFIKLWALRMSYSILYLNEFEMKRFEAYFCLPLSAQRRDQLHSGRICSDESSDQQSHAPRRRRWVDEEHENLSCCCCVFIPTWRNGFNSCSSLWVFLRIYI